MCFGLYYEPTLLYINRDYMINYRAVYMLMKPKCNLTPNAANRKFGTIMNQIQPPLFLSRLRS
jgi:hypothetical protein